MQFAMSGPYNPICLPRISFMSGEHGTGGHAGSSEGKDSPQMGLFEDEGALPNGKSPVEAGRCAAT